MSLCCQVLHHNDMHGALNTEEFKVRMKMKYIQNYKSTMYITSDKRTDIKQTHAHSKDQH